MDFSTIESWDEEVWEKWKVIYHEAFGEKGAKPEKVIRNMFHKQMCYFHIAQNESECYAIALSGKLKGTKLLLIDYLAVREKDQNNGIGRMMVDYIKKWAITNRKFDGIVIEVEAENTVENLARIQFWKGCGFTLNDYIHHYRVVPEPYQAMHLHVNPKAVLPEKGEEFFMLMEQFHKKSFRGA